MLEDFYTIKPLPNIPVIEKDYIKKSYNENLFTSIEPTHTGLYPIYAKDYFKPNDDVEKVDLGPERNFNTNIMADETIEETANYAFSWMGGDGPLEKKHIYPLVQAPDIITTPPDYLIPSLFSSDEEHPGLQMLYNELTDTNGNKLNSNYSSSRRNYKISNKPTQLTTRSDSDFDYNTTFSNSIHTPIARRKLTVQPAVKPLDTDALLNSQGVQEKITILNDAGSPLNEAESKEVENDIEDEKDKDNSNLITNDPIILNQVISYNKLNKDQLKLLITDLNKNYINVRETIKNELNIDSINNTTKKQDLIEILILSHRGKLTKRTI